MNSKINLLTISVILIAGINVFFASCKKEDPKEATSIELVSGENQTGGVESSLTNVIEVLVKDQDGQAFQNTIVNFAVTEGSVSSATGTTDADGKASVTWTLGATEGAQTLIITAFKSDGTTELNGSPITVNATATVALTEVTDIDGNVYNVVQIGNQIWMAENLKATKYADNTPITKIEDETAWGNLGNNNIDKAYCFYDNDENNDYGALYTWAAATNGVVYTTVDVQGVCPDGWHLPTDAEFQELSDYLGGDGEAGGKLKETGTTHWNSPNAGATNSSGFTALGGGYRFNGQFEEKGNIGFWWTSQQESGSPDYGNCWYINATENGIMDKSEVKSTGISVRCIKD